MRDVRPIWLPSLLAQVTRFQVDARPSPAQGTLSTMARRLGTGWNWKIARKSSMAAILSIGSSEWAESPTLVFLLFSLDNYVNK